MNKNIKRYRSYYEDLFLKKDIKLMFITKQMEQHIIKKLTTVVIRFSGLKNKRNSIYGTHFFSPLFFS